MKVAIKIRKAAGGFALQIFNFKPISVVKCTALFNVFIFGIKQATHS